MFLPKKLKQCRKTSRLSLERLAVEINKKTGFSVSRQTLENWEKGRNRPSIDGVISIADFFNRPLVYFFDQKQHLTSECSKA